MNQELLINLGNGTQTVREAEQLDIHPHLKPRDYFCQFGCVVFGLAPGTFKSHRRESRTQKRNQTAGGESDAAFTLIKMFDLLILNISNEARERVVMAFLLGHLSASGGRR